VTLTLDLVQTVAFAGAILFAGYGLRKLLPVLTRFNIPAPVVGALPVATLLAWAYFRGLTPIRFDTALQTPLMIAFFTSVGFGASIGLLRRGGPLVVLFFVLSAIITALQNVLGAAVAVALGQHPLLGVLAGSTSMAGGPATALAFGPYFEQAGIPGATTLAVAAAMAGIVAGGIVGGPVATYLIERHARRVPPQMPVRGTMENIAEGAFSEPVAATPSGEDVEAYALLKHIVLMLVAMWIGASVSGWIASMGITLPAYIGAMVVAAVLRNVDEATGLVGISQRLIDDLGSVALALFLSIALMTLRLWEVVGLAIPLVIILIAQVMFVAAVGLAIVPRLMGRDYDSAVMSGGFCGFMLGTTANAMANMGALVERYGPAPKAYLVVPLVGAFFIDFTNALLITFFLNLWR
jgi:glutamate:Na+ symporter, ESS family